MASPRGSLEVTDCSNCTKGELLTLVTELQNKLLVERRRSGTFETELRLARERNLEMQAKVEQEEEFISNKLLKRLEQLKREKQALANEVEQEEEFLTNTLQKRLEKLNKEKVDLENQLEAEQEYIVNKLQKQLEHLTNERKKLTHEKVDLENQLEAEQEYIVNKLQKQVEQLDLEKRKLQLEKIDMQRQVTALDKAVDKLKSEKVNLESAMEMEEENIVNRMQRQLDHVFEKYQLLERCLEAKGISIKEIGAEPITIDQIRTGSHSYSSSPSPSFHYASTCNTADWREARMVFGSQGRHSSRVRDDLHGRFGLENTD